MRTKRKQIKSKKKTPKAFVGAAIAGLSFVSGLAANAKKKNAMEEAEREARAVTEANAQQTDALRLEDFKAEGEGVVDYYRAKGGKIYAKGGNTQSYATSKGKLVPISSDTEIAKGPKHAKGGMDLLNKSGKPFLNIEGDETIKDGNKVYSDQTIFKDGKTYAEHSEKLAKEKGKIEKKMGTLDRIGRSTGKRKLALLDAKEDALFQHQEANKTEPTVVGKADLGDFIDERRTGLGSRGDFGNNDTTLAKPESKFGKYAPYLDNVMNAILTATSPKVPKPVTQRIVPLKTKVNVTPQVNAVTRAVDSASRNIKQSSSNSNTARNEITSVRLKGAEEKAKIMANKQNVEAGLHNQNVQNAQNISRQNLGIVNQYQDKAFARSNDIQSRISDNASNLAGDFIDKRNFDAQTKYDDERLEIARQTTVGGTALRADLLSSTERKKLQQDPEYARQQRQRYINNPKELKKFDAIVAGTTKTLAIPNIN